MITLKRTFDIISNYKTAYAKPIMVAGRSGTGWKTFSTDVFIALMDKLSKGLISKGIAKGDKIGIMSGNRPEWNLVDLASSQIGAVIVPLYPTLSIQDLGYIIQDADVKIIFVSNAELVAKVKEATISLANPITIYCLDAAADQLHYEQLVEQGAQLDIDLASYRDAVLEDDLLTLIYTSGTTGKPKGVLLTHKNILSNVQASSHLLTANYTKALSFLPLCHIFERMVVYLYLSKGLQIHYSENLDNVVVDINEVKPHIFTTVPRVLEKVYDKVVEKGNALTGIKKSLFFWALALGLKFQEPKNNSTFYNIKLAIARKLIFSKWREALGGEIQGIISGGAALQERLARVFWAAGIYVVEGYGLTETSPVIAVNSFVKTDVKFGTVGRVLSNLDVKIADDGEILVKGPSITKGYYNNQEATQEAFDADQYFHTGDIGEITADGFLKITDRKKEIFKTTGGKYIAPQMIENKMMESTLIGQLMVIGENKKFPAALIVPAFEVLENYCKHKGIPFGSKEEVIKRQEVLDKYQKEIDRLNESLGHWERIKKFVLLPKEWTIDRGEITPKLSLKRKVLAEKFQDSIAKIYAE